MVIEETFDKCEVCRLGRTRKSSLFPSLKFFRVEFVTFNCNAVGQAFDNLDFFIDIEKYSGHLELPVLNLDHDLWWIFEESFDEPTM